MERAHIRSVALFFFFSLLDERQALRATFKTLEDLKKRSARLKSSEKLEAPDFVEMTQNSWDNQKKFLSSTVVATPHVEGWIPPQGLDLGPWRQFRKQTTPQELLAVIWSRVLGYSDKDIAKGLGISIGTVQYRISNGLKLLGTMTPIGSRSG